ncbi:GspE/PulE family protein [Methylibium rhizosphaerae]|uniref:GspE/PulE family protein n=1 Tax=Methylibium rhizosphaerae TaxID=2570323 RepID=UPI0011265DC6|nr:ATPase, T2SS/T4P/T4SS family [Methylibium rhizosphaerae]
MSGGLHDLTAAGLRAARQAGGAAWIARLAEQGGHAEDEIVAALGAATGLPVAGMAELRTWLPVFDRISLVKAQARHCLLMKSSSGEAQADIAVLVDPWADDTWTWLESCAQRPLRFWIASPSNLHAMLSRHEAAARATDAIVSLRQEQAQEAGVDEVLTLESASQASSPAVQLVNSALYDALKLGASDIHMESTADGLAVKYRIDGVLDAVTQVSNVALAEQIISRLKVLAELDIAERRVPQDGSFRVHAQGRQVDLRLSIMPSVHGEDAVVRVLDKQAMVRHHGRLTLDALGLDSRTVGQLRDLVEAAYGMVLVTGPTGSGKTTTLYAALSEMNTGRDKIITIEDPVEYQIAGILQIPVNDKKGLTFARGLRSILRHDPDRIMVGEIRDRETAEIAVQSALTGHLVLSTVHANNVFDVFGRFTHMGLDPYALASALNGVWAQRLVRINCTECSEPDEPTEVLLAKCGLTRERVGGFQFRKGRGCGHCRGSGYRGRRAVAEFLRLTDGLRELVASRQSVGSLREAARSQGTRSLFDAGLDLVARGETTLEEVRRVTLST